MRWNGAATARLQMDRRGSPPADRQRSKTPDSQGIEPALTAPPLTSRNSVGCIDLSARPTAELASVSQPFRHRRAETAIAEGAPVSSTGRLCAYLRTRFGHGHRVSLTGPLGRVGLFNLGQSQISQTAIGF